MKPAGRAAVAHSGHPIRTTATSSLVSSGHLRKPPALGGDVKARSTYGGSWLWFGKRPPSAHIWRGKLTVDNFPICVIDGPNLPDPGRLSEDSGIIAGKK